MEKTPADYYVFVEVPPASLIIGVERGDLTGAIVSMGNKADSCTIPYFSDGKPCFKSAKIGDNVVYRYEVIRKTFKHENKTIGILPITEVKYGFS